MNAADVLDTLHRLGLCVSVRGQNIRVAPKAAITNEARELIRAHKAALLPVLAAREAAQERAAILEYDGGLSRPSAERVAALAEAFYSHLFGPGKVTNCCYAPAGRYCPEGRRLRDAYYGAFN